MALIVVALAAVLVTGGLVASNMGFKLNYPLKKAAVGVSKSGTQSIGLPYNRQVGIDTAQDLFKDIQSSGITIQNIQRYDILTDQNAVYASGTANYGLDKAAGYLVKVASNGDYIIVGSHDPSFTVNLKAAAGGVSKSGTQRYAHPYHGVSASAKELFQELTPEVQNVQRYDSVTDQNQVYASGTADFALAPGQSYLVKVSVNKSFIPAHY